MNHVLSGKVLLGILLVTATTGGFTLGYFVGRSLSPSHSTAQGLHVAEGENPSPVPAIKQNPPTDGSPLAVSGAVHAPSTEDSQSSASVPAVVGKPEAVTPKPDDSKASAPAGKTSPGTETKSASGEKRTGTEATTSAGGSSGAPSGRIVYTVQAGAFRNLKDAEGLKRKLEAKNYKTSIKKEAGTKGVVLFKVRTGEFEDKKEASLFALKLKNTDGLNAFATEKK